MSPLLVAGNIVGYIGAVILWFQVVFGSRHLFKYYTRDTVFINKIHKQIGIYGTMLVFVHPLIEMMVRFESFFWIFIPDFAVESAKHITYGRFSLILLTIVWVTSALVREKIKWKPWKYLHLLTYPIIFLVFIHMMDIGTFFEEYLIIKVVWALMMLSFFGVICVRFLAWFGLTKNKVIITNIEMVGDSILLVTFRPSKILVPKLGQHVYVQSGICRSEHPFTVMEYNKDREEITLGIRKLGNFWGELLKKRVGDVLFVDGPYGIFTQEAQTTLPKVIISGGIGVTPFVDLVKEYGKETTYINCNRKQSDIVRGDILEANVTRYVDILEEYEGEKKSSIKIGRISGEVIKEIVGPLAPNQSYFVCGSPMFITIVKKILQDLGVKREAIYYEALGF
jgi:predicted ferric reductase